VEMKVNYPNNKRNTQFDFFDNYHNIKNFVQVDHFEKKLKTAPFFLFTAPEKPPVAEKKFQVGKVRAYKCQIIVLKFQQIR
jgi:hypothetical protein